MKKPVIMVSILLLLVGCGPNSQFNRAKKLEAKGEYYKAWQGYQEFAARYPNSERAAEALFRAGWMAQKGLEDCTVAKTFYDKVLAEYPQADFWAEAAAHQPLNCPDYFPLIPGSEWVEGDSDTKGTISRTKIKCRPLSAGSRFPSQAGKLVREYYAGNKKFDTTRYSYRKTENKLLEYVSEKDPRPKIILKWPLETGQKWQTKMNAQLFDYELISIAETVKVKAGTFTNCLKIRSIIRGGVGARFEYYAPGVGRVLTTLSTRSGEKRNTELISYKIAELKGYQDKESEMSEDESIEEK